MALTGTWRRQGDDRKLIARHVEDLTPLLGTLTTLRMRVALSLLRPAIPIFAKTVVIVAKASDKSAQMKQFELTAELGMDALRKLPTFSRHWPMTWRVSPLRPRVFDHS